MGVKSYSFFGVILDSQSHFSSINTLAPSVNLPTITTSHSAIFVRPLLMIRLSQLPLPLFASAWTIPSSHSVLHKKSISYSASKAQSCQSHCSPTRHTFINSHVIYVGRFCLSSNLSYRLTPFKHSNVV